MYNSLDSIEHVVACLQQKHKGAKISVTPYFTRNLEEMELVNKTDWSDLEYNRNKVYFGVFTIADLDYWYGDTEVKNMFGLLLNPDITNGDIGDIANVLIVQPNSQVVEMCYGVIIDHYSANDQATFDLQVAGQFRGFEINIIE